jgi:hypothetical protein
MEIHPATAAPAADDGERASEREKETDLPVRQIFHSRAKKAYRDE